jgi:hypothetical protein
MVGHPVEDKVIKFIWSVTLSKVEIVSVQPSSPG